MAVEQTDVQEEAVEPSTTATETLPVDGEVDPLSPDSQVPSTSEVETDASEEEAGEPDIEEASPESGNFAKFKALYKEHPELRTIVGREAAMSELFPQFSEAKQIRELFPTVEDAERSVEDSRNLRQLSEDFRTNPPAYLEALKASDEYAFQKLVASLPSYLEHDEQSYLTVARPIINNLFDNLYQKSHGNAEYQTALAAVAQSLGINLGSYRPTQAAGNPELERLKAQLSERETRDRETQVASFFQQADSEFADRTVADIDKALGKTGFSDRIKETIKREVWDAVNDEMKSQPQTMAYINQARARAAQGRATSTERKDLVNFIYKRLNPVAARLLKEQISTWNKEVTAKSTADLTKKKAVAASTSNGNSAPKNGTQLPPAATGPRTVDDILKARRLQAGINR